MDHSVERLTFLPGRFTLLLVTHVGDASETAFESILGVIFNPFSPKFGRAENTLPRNFVAKFREQHLWRAPMYVKNKQHVKESLQLGRGY